MKQYVLFTSMAITMLMTGCVSVPNGPSTMALPGTGKDFNQFRNDDLSCRDFALSQIGGKTVNQQYNASFAQSAAVGTAVGAAIGAAAGGGQGAAIGAGMGALTGSAIGANAASVSGYSAQNRYDHAYIQCMYAAGHRVPVPASMARTYPQPVAAPARTYDYTPPPPPPPNYH